MKEGVAKKTCNSLIKPLPSGKKIKSGTYKNQRSEVFRDSLYFTTCRVSTDWISYNYLKAQHLIAGCKTEIIELLASDQE
jgi:hypothetical protein